MWDHCGDFATRAWAHSGTLERAKRAHRPFALVLTAGIALQPGFGAVADVARQEIAAGEAVLGIRVGDGGDRAARARSRGLPRVARVLAAGQHQLPRGYPCVSEV